MDSLFELVDVWSSGLDAMSYCAFLRNLFDKTTVAVTEIDPLTGSKRSVVYIWRDERECTFDSSFADGNNDHDGDARREAPPQKVKRSQSSKQRRRAAITVQKAARGRQGRRVASQRKHAAAVIQASVKDAH